MIRPRKSWEGFFDKLLLHSSCESICNTPATFGANRTNSFRGKLDKNEGAHTILH